MTETKHTPGPWEFEPDSGCIATNDRLVGHPVAYVAGSRPERMENGRLIAAAPELLEALRGMILLFDDAREGCLLLERADHIPITNGDQEVIDKVFIAATATIRKAKGE